MAAMILALIPGIGESELYAIYAVLATSALCGIVFSLKLRRQRRESATTLEKQRVEAETAAAAEKEKTNTLLAEAKKAEVEAAAKYKDIEQRFNTHREVSDRRANDASLQISRLETDLAASRELAAQLVPTQSRIKDLETALAAEQGRVKAQEQAIEATNARAADFEKRMIDAKDLLLKHKAEMQETAVELKKVRDEQAAYAAAGGPEAELAKAKEANQQAEAKMANLQRALKAAEARTEMVQKEFMNAVGMATAPTMGTSASMSDKKMRELEEKLTHVEAEARKRAREDGYKIAELEYRLSEAQEAVKTAQVHAAPVPEPVVVAAPEPEPVVAPEPVNVAVAEAATEPEVSPVAEAPQQQVEPIPAEAAKEEPAVIDAPVTPVVEAAAVVAPVEPVAAEEAAVVSQPAVMAPVG